MSSTPQTDRRLDLFSGLNGWTQAARDRGVTDITTLDLGVDGRFEVDFKLDILTVRSLRELERGRGPFRVIYASPPCTAFSVAAMGKNWQRHPTKRVIVGPKHPRAELGMRIAEHTFRLIDDYVAEEADAGRQVWYVIENPIGALRVMPFTVDRTDRVSTWYCQWDDRRPGLDKPRAKPTDLWTNVRGPWPMCRQGADDHEAAPRGAKTGTQGHKTAADRSLVPYKLALAVHERVSDPLLPSGRWLRSAPPKRIRGEQLAFRFDYGRLMKRWPDV